MSVVLYDTALMQKLKKWTEKTNVHIYGPNELRQLFEVIADETNDSPIQLPIICVRRNGAYTIKNFNKRVMTYDGLTMDSNDGWQIFDENGDSLGFTYLTYELAKEDYEKIIKENPNRKLTIDRRDGTKSLQLNAIPIQLNYQVDVYTRYFDEADVIVRDLVFNIINHPNFKVQIPYNGVNFEHNATIRISETVSDNSDISEVAFKRGQFSRLSFDINIDNAYLWDAKVRNDVSVEFQFEE